MWDGSGELMLHWRNVQLDAFAQMADGVDGTVGGGEGQGPVFQAAKTSPSPQDLLLRRLWH